MPDEQVVLQPVFQKSTKPSAIQLVNADGTESTTIYDLRGQRYDSSSPLRPGIYIKNGKKIYIK